MQQSSRRLPSLIGIALAVYAVLLLLSFFLIWRMWPATPETGHDPTAKPRPVAQATELTSEEKSRIEVFRAAKESVVNVASAQYVRNRFTLLCVQAFEEVHYWGTT